MFKKILIVSVVLSSCSGFGNKKSSDIIKGRHLNCYEYNIEDSLTIRIYQVDTGYYISLFNLDTIVLSRDEEVRYDTPDSFPLQAISKTGVLYDSIKVNKIGKTLFLSKNNKKFPKEYNNSEIFKNCNQYSKIGKCD